MLQTKYSKWLLIHQYLLSVFIPFHRSKKSQIIMTTRQTGGLNKGYKPTSPASA
ncbi:hypothetical protein HPA24_09450 [Streptococcus suis]|uniref:hypothetical protein n=1 Tax=Streptococcus suis TaxID=1307 RepID=UPI001295ECE4|nr:hypothetical protein [Streptococcus suis]MCK3860136.1 hypothetical protein [Streptococcus suis]MCK3948661.1 hypothetical protein [Streptococcus suis]MCK3963883.1 hypothetical protein [Streptococcus suis]MCK3990056.1 hypothetical protein [Streptococcus suis]MCK4022406.1 hypothetical protein [Streptococcus suis]